MGEKVAATCLHLSQPVVSHSPSLSQKALASSALSPSSSSSNSYSSSRRSRRGKSVSDGAAAAALVRFVRSPPHPPLFFGINLPRSRSCEFSSYGYSRSSRSQSLRRSCSSSSSRGSDAFFDEEFAGSLQETTDDGDAELDNNASSSNPKSSSSIDGMEGKDCFAMMYNRNHNSDFPRNSNSNLRLGSSNNSYSNSPSSRRAFGSEAVAGGAEEGEMISASVEHKANSVDFPLSLRMLKRKKKQQQEWEEGEGLFGESSASASSSAVAGSCSVKKAFSSMVFMIRELHTYTLHMRETVFPHHQQGMGMGMGMGMDLQGVLARVRKEMHASFVWLFQHIFSSTPTLMVYVMILLANFTVYSMTATAAIAPPPRPTMEATTITSESHHHHIIHHQQQQRFDPLSTIKGRTASVGGSGGGGGKVRPMAGATDGGGDGRFEDSFDQHRTMFRDEMSSSSRVTSLGNGNPAAAVSEEKGEEKEELKLWNSIVEEASRMQGDVYLDRDTLHRLVSPVTVVMEPEDYTHYLWTDLLYQRAVLEEPDNPLILSNYAQFLYLVVHDLDRAEEMFKRAVGVGPPEADSLSRYASFLWVARNDLAGAEEKFLEAIEADPTNTIHAANYAHFLWNTGGEDTCYPLTS